MAEEALVAEKDYPEVRIDVAASEVLPLYTDADLDRAADECRSLLARDDTPATKLALESEFAREMDGLGGWFHRIEFPARGVTSASRSITSAPDPGPLNTLWRRLDADQGTRLRPYPKWTYLRGIMPSLSGKSVLDLGCSCGFFSFRFAEAGATTVTGVEVIPEQHAQAMWAARQLGFDDVTRFRNSDALFDRSLAPHDVVFMSEVFISSVLPFYSLLRAVNLAREYVIIDDFFTPAPDQPAALRMFRDTSWSSERIAWTGFAMTEQLLLEFLYLFGVEPSRVKRYHGHNGHAVMVIDTRDAFRFRDEHVAHPALRSMLAMGGGHPGAPGMPHDAARATSPHRQPAAPASFDRLPSDPRQLARDALGALAKRLLVRARRR